MLSCLKFQLQAHSNLTSPSVLGRTVAPPMTRSPADVIWELVPDAVRRELQLNTQEEVDAFLAAPRSIDYVDFFSGSGNMGSALAASGLQGRNYEILKDPQQNMATISGQALALKWAATVSEGGLLVGGFPCSTWVWLARSHTKRSKERIWGDESREDVRQANDIINFVSALSAFAHARKVFFLWEQPHSSLAFQTPCWRVVRELPNYKEQFLWLGSYGHDMPKPTRLVGTLPCMSKLRVARARQGSSAGIGWERKGKWVAGTSKLKESQVYPPRFCEKVASLLTTAREWRSRQAQRPCPQLTAAIENAAAAAVALLNRNPPVPESIGRPVEIPAASLAQPVRAAAWLEAELDEMLNEPPCSSPAQGTPPAWNWETDDELCLVASSPEWGSKGSGPSGSACAGSASSASTSTAPGLPAWLADAHSQWKQQGSAVDISDELAAMGTFAATAQASPFPSLRCANRKRKHVSHGDSNSDSDSEMQ